MFNVSQQKLKSCTNRIWPVLSSSNYAAASQVAHVATILQAAHLSMLNGPGLPVADPIAIGDPAVAAPIARQARNPSSQRNRSRDRGPRPARSE